MIRHGLLIIISVLVLLQWAVAVRAEEIGLIKGPVSRGLGVSYGQNWSPHTDDIRFTTADVFWVYDRDPFFPYKASPVLNWILEAQAGATVDGPAKLILSAGVLVKLLLTTEPDSAGIYALGGIGVIYTGFKVEGQGLNFNFNPQFGFGVDILKKYYVQLRWHHVSNGGLNENNTGINSVVIHSGVYF